MEVFPNLNTVVLISSDIKVIDWCRHALEPAFSVKVIDSVQSYSYALAAFQNLVLVDTSLFNGQTEKIFTDIARRGRALFLVKFDDSFPLSYVQRHYKRCIPFPCDLDLLREVVERQAAASSDVDRIFKKAERGFVRDVDISGFEKFAGSSKIIIDVKRRLAEAAQREISVLLLGESGTGKSFRAQLLAEKYGIKLIIDDGLLIYNDKIIAGRSAKMEKTFLAAVKVALFDDKKHRDGAAKALQSHSFKKILILVFYGCFRF